MTTRQRTRLDALLVHRGLADTAQRAQALVAAGLVEVDGVRAGSAALTVTPRAAVRLTDRDHPWAGRGGLKLDAALDGFGVGCSGRVCLDAGASTGGFTDVLIQRGASLVYAVDVGRGQLHARLAADPRVRVLDRTNVRTLEHLDGPVPSLVTLDLSFISLRSVLANLATLAPGAEVVALFKPQFELARGAVGRGGVVRDAADTAAALTDFASWAGQSGVAAVVGEPLAAGVRGAKGNQEWLVHLRLAGSSR
ncbi:MAG: TlyA family RNA methyltransferase [Candidatus Dormibacteraeota bacterium]|uniref:TlyA family RNA methyltransferase n=1 Tax=Candidatus Amunia macphersoniae TaxID=3127014 RepID=A0A934KS97_9BACT|nr:TlyA family RNA methyltransferase [Candidatus Dormibacteraeota bacterium]